MKKWLLLLLIFALSATLIASCGEPTPTPTPDPSEPELLLRGDEAVIFGAGNAFTLIYGASELSLGSSIADKIATAVSELGLKKPEYIVDRDKTETICEFLIGDTDRDLSAEAKAALHEKIDAEPRAKHWVWLYSDGQVALYASSREAYEMALEELRDKYYSAGEIKMKNETTSSIGYVPGPHEAYMSYEIPDNFYEGYTDPFAEIISEYEEVKITRATANKYTIDCVIDDNNYYRVEFVRKKWGMWMLGGMHYCENGTLNKLTSTSTDYEFVMTCASKGEYVAHGGNHGDYTLGDAWDANDSTKSNDRLLDMTLYNAETGEKIVLDTVGTSITVKGLRMVLHHNLYELEYSQENVLVNVENSYLFSGYDVFCSTNIYATQDIRVKNVRTAMLPIMKEYGNCMMLYAEDGSTIYAVTSSEGLGKEYDYKVAGLMATKLDAWGVEHPEYHITVEIYNPDEMLMHNFGTDRDDVSIRDMNGGATNKVYFTSFASDGKMEWGTEYNYVASWSFSIQEDFEQPTRDPDIYVIKGK